MIDQKIIEFLKQKHGKYDFNKLIEFIQCTGFVYKARKINGAPIAIATINGIYVDVDKVDYYNDKLVYFIILHETCHMKRITKFGGDWMLHNLSLEDFEDFTKHIFIEEILADRYACLMFYNFNKVIYPWYQTQQLDQKHKQEDYAPMARLYFGEIQNDINKYNELIVKFIGKDD
jgi:hypothetical protein